MAQSDFDSFAEETRELFGLNAQEAANLLEALEEEEGFDLDTDDIRDFASEALDLIDFGEYELEPSEYDLDSDWPDDQWVEVGEEMEVTIEYGEK